MFYIHDTISFRQRQTDLKLTNWKFKSTLFVLTFLIILIPTHHTFADITTGLIGHWAFDENSGITANDSSVNNNVGALINGPTWTKGKIGGALLFDGVNDYVNIYKYYRGNDCF
jgi:hypothetical protein